LAGPALPDGEGPQEDQPADDRYRHARIAEPVARLLDQPEHRASQAQHAQQTADPVEAARYAVVDGQAPEQRDRDRHWDHVDDEDPPPGGDLDQRAAAQWSDHRGDPRPG